MEPLEAGDVVGFRAGAHEGQGVIVTIEDQDVVLAVGERLGSGEVLSVMGTNGDIRVRLVVIGRDKVTEPGDLRPFAPPLRTRGISLLRRQARATSDFWSPDEGARAAQRAVTQALLHAVAEVSRPQLWQPLVAQPAASSAGPAVVRHRIATDDEDDDDYSDVSSADEPQVGRPKSLPMRDAPLSPRSSSGTARELRSSGRSRRAEPRAARGERVTMELLEEGNRPRVLMGDGRSEFPFRGSRRVRFDDAMDSGSMTLQLQLELVRELRRLRRHQSDSESSGAELEGGSRKFGSVARMRKKIFREPWAHRRRYREAVKLALGVKSPEQVWQYRDHSRKVLGSFSRFRSFWRCHYSISEALAAFYQGLTGEGCCHLVQLQKAIHQAALDGGDWSSATLLLMHQDPLSRSRWGGGEDEMHQVCGYRKALADLQKSTRDLGRTSAGTELAADNEQGDDAKGAARRGGNAKYTAKQWRQWRKQQGATPTAAAG